MQTIIPLAASSEILLTWFYDHLVRRPGDPAAGTFLVGFDSLPIRAEKSLWDLAVWSRERPALVETLTTTPADVLVAGLGDPSTSERRPGAGRSGGERFRAHLAAYGHLVYNLDPLNPVPADAPGPLVEACASRCGARAPTRTCGRRRWPSGGSGRRRGCSTRWARSAAGRSAGCWAGRSGWPRCARTRSGTWGWRGRELRRVLLELGRRLLEDPEDVFWLRETELEALVAGRAVPGTCSRSRRVEHRQEVWRGQRRVDPAAGAARAGTAGRLLRRRAARRRRPTRPTCSPASARARAG